MPASVLATGARTVNETEKHGVFPHGTQGLTGNYGTTCNGGEVLGALGPHIKVIEPVLSLFLCISCSNGG